MCLLELNFEKSKFMSVDVDDVVVHTRCSAVGHARGQLYVARTSRFDEAQRTAGQRYDDVIEGMNVPARFCTGAKVYSVTITRSFSICTAGTAFTFVIP